MEEKTQEELEAEANDFQKRYAELCKETGFHHAAVLQSSVDTIRAGIVVARLGKE